MLSSVPLSELKNIADGLWNSVYLLKKYGCSEISKLTKIIVKGHIQDFSWKWPTIYCTSSDTDTHLMTINLTFMVEVPKFGHDRLMLKEISMVVQVFHLVYATHHYLFTAIAWWALHIRDFVALLLMVIKCLKCTDSSSPSFYYFNSSKCLETGWPIFCNLDCFEADEIRFLNTVRWQELCSFCMILDGVLTSIWEGCSFYCLVENVSLIAAHAPSSWSIMSHCTHWNQRKIHQSWNFVKTNTDLRCLESHECHHKISELYVDQRTGIMAP